MPILYFFLIKSGDNLYPLPNQQDDTGNAINESFICQCSQSVLKKYPEKTVFCTTSIIDLGIQYSVGFIHPVNHAPLSDNDNPGLDEKLAFMEYCNNNNIPLEATDDIVTTTPDTEKEESLRVQNRPGPRTILQILRDKYPLPNVQNDGFYVDPEVWDLLLCNTEKALPTLIYGCQGLGKTELALLLGKRTGKKVHVYDMGAMHDPMTQLLGTHRLVSDGKNTVSTFDYARFTQEIQEEGIIVFDEINRAPQCTANILYPLLDSRRELHVEAASGQDERIIKVHPRCSFVATANIGTRHVGTLPIDPALMSRFLPIELKHLQQDVEENLLIKRFGIRRVEAKTIVAVANGTRIKAQTQELDNELSPRETLRCAQYVSFGFSVLNAMKAVFLPLFEGTETEGPRAVVKGMFQTM